MENTDNDIQNIIDQIISKYPFLSIPNEFSEEASKMCSIIGSYVYFTCFIETYCGQPYMVIYDSIWNRDPKPSNKALKEDDYWSNFNTGHYDDYDTIGEGACLVVLNKLDLSLINIYYFKDAYNFNFHSIISGVSGRYISINYFEHCYVFKDGKYLNMQYVDSQIFALSNDYWIVYPTSFYDASCNWEVVDFKHERVFPIHSLDRWYNGWRSNYDDNSCLLDVDKGALIFSQKELSVSLPLNLLYIDDCDLDKLEYKNVGTNMGAIEMPGRG